MSTTAPDIIEGDYDFVLCTYGYVLAKYKRRKANRSVLEQAQVVGSDAAIKKSQREGKQFRRPVLSLFSDIYQDVGLFIHHLILNEAQFLRKFDGQRHTAIKSLPYRKMIMLSGTPFSNRWSDIFGLVDLLPCEPLQTVQDYFRVFGNVNGDRRSTPSVSQRNKLIKYLQSFSFGRPASLIQLPDMTRHTWTFSLNAYNEAAVLEHTEHFARFASIMGKSADEKGVMIHAVRAQHVAANAVIFMSSVTVEAAQRSGAEEIGGSSAVEKAGCKRVSSFSIA